MDSMFPILIKNEPIETEDIRFIPESFRKQSVVIKCERVVSPNDNNRRSGTIICSESEYLAEGYAPFESIIVKEEPRLNPYEEIADKDDKVAKNLECYVCRFVVALRDHLKTHSVAGFDRKFPKKLIDRIGERSACDQCDKTFTNRAVRLALMAT